MDLKNIKGEENIEVRGIDKIGNGYAVILRPLSVFNDYAESATDWFARLVDKKMGKKGNWQEEQKKFGSVWFYKIKGDSVASYVEIRVPHITFAILNNPYQGVENLPTEKELEDFKSSAQILEKDLDVTENLQQKQIPILGDKLD